MSLEKSTSSTLDRVCVSVSSMLSSMSDAASRRFSRPPVLAAKVKITLRAVLISSKARWQPLWLLVSA